jgi:hypothetical protein
MHHQVLVPVSLSVSLTHGCALSVSLTPKLFNWVSNYGFMEQVLVPVSLDQSAMASARDFHQQRKKASSKVSH